MRRLITTLGVCLTTTLMLSVAGAVGASPAMAEHLEFGRCVNVGLGVGSYADSNCTISQAGGEYEWKALAAGEEVKFKSESGVKILETPSGAGDIECQTDHDKGALTGPTTDRVKITFHECVFIATGGECRSVAPGAPPGAAGVIHTNVLASELSWLEKATTTVGLDLQPQTAPLFTEIECEVLPGVPAKIEVSGSVIGQLLPVNEMTEDYELVVKCVDGQQEWTKDEGEPEDTLLSTVTFMGETTQETACEEEVTPDKITMKEPVELWAEG